MDLKSKQKLFYKERFIEEYIPYSHFYAKDVVMTKASDMLFFIEIKGIDANQNDVSQNIASVIKTISQLNHSSAIWVTNIRDKINDYQRIKYKNINNEFTANFINDYQDDLVKNDLYQNRLVITVIVRANFQKINNSIKIFQEKYDKQQLSLKFNNQYKRLTEIKDSILSGLSNFNPRVLKLNNSESQEILSFLGYSLNLEYQSIVLEQKNISKSLCFKRHYFAENTIEIQSVNNKRFAAVLAIKNYTDKTYHNILEKLNSIDCSYINTHIFQPLDTNTSKDLIVRQKNRLNQVADYALSQIDELDTALDDLQSQRLSFGYHSNAILLHAESISALDNNINLISRIFLDAGIMVTREGLNLESSFMSMLPANFEFVTRKYLISSKNFIDLLNLEYSDTGYINQNHLGNYLMPFKKQDNNLFKFNMHSIGNNTKGHTLLISPTGSGKTTLMLAIDAFSQQYGGKRYFFDRNLGMKSYVDALNGSYFILKPGIDTKINPIPRYDTRGNRFFLYEFIKNLILDSEEKLDEVDSEEIKQAIDGVYSLDIKNRNLANLVTFFSCNWKFLTRFNIWLKSADGLLGWAFDNKEDDFNLLNNIIGLDFTHILNNKKVLLPLMQLLFFRIENSLDGDLTGIYLDEAWQFLNHPYWDNKINEYLRTFRKLNAYLFFATQNPHDIANSKLLHSITENIATQIFMPSNNLDAKIYLNNFGLNQNEINLMKNLDASKREVLVKQDKDVNILNFNLVNLNKYLKVFSNDLSKGD